MNRDEIVRRGRAAVAWLRRPTGKPTPLTPWGWAADASLALLLTIGGLSAVLAHSEFRSGDAPYYPMLDGRLPPPPGPPLPFEQTLGRGSLDWGDLVLAALTTLPLLTRRRFPLVSFWIIALAAPFLFDQVPDADPTWTVVASVVAAYSAPMYSHYRNLALTSVVLAAVWFIAGNRNDLPGLPSSVVTFLLVASVGLAANAIHTWRQRAQVLQREQEVTTRLAVDRERARLARELHDIVGHNVSVMVVQAGAARKVMDSAPDQAREALLAVEAGGRAAMTELRQAIGLLTLDSDEATRPTRPHDDELDPPPGLDQLPRLAERIRETGVPVTLTISGPVGPLPPGVELAAYRVVQEALTNAVRHAAGAAVSIAVTADAAELRIEVTDAGGSPSVAGSGGGRGLAGLRDRLAGYGGTLTAGRRPTGGYRVSAVIPLLRRGVE